MASHDAPVELEVTNEENFVVTPAMARLLVKLARRHLEREANGSEAAVTEEEKA